MDWCWIESPSLSDQVILRIPATTGHIGLARATATALAARLDFTYDRLTDLHIAIDEVCGRVLAASDPPPRRLELAFEPTEAALEVSVRGDSPLKPGAQFLNAWSQVILDAIVSDLRVEPDPRAFAVSFIVRREAG
jgi:hypothetical protein